MTDLVGQAIDSVVVPRQRTAISLHCAGAIAGCSQRVGITRDRRGQRNKPILQVIAERRLQAVGSGLPSPHYWPGHTHRLWYLAPEGKTVVNDCTEPVERIVCQANRKIPLAWFEDMDARLPDAVVAIEERALRRVRGLPSFAR